MSMNVRTILVETQDGKKFRIGIPADAEMTFGPFSPPVHSKPGQTWSSEDRKGTLRVYRQINNKKQVIAVFAGVIRFRDLDTITYSEFVAREEGAAIWKSDENGYQREDNMKRQHAWVNEDRQLKAGPVVDVKTRRVRRKAK